MEQMAFGRIQLVQRRKRKSKPKEQRPGLVATLIAQWYTHYFCSTLGWLTSVVLHQMLS